MNLKKIKKEKENNVSYIKDYTKKNINKKKIIILVLVLIFIISAITLLYIYKSNVEFRFFCDKHIFRKEIEENNLASINIEDLDNSNILVYSNYIAVLNNNTFIKYNSLGKEETRIKIEITNPLISSSGEYIVIAEKNGSKIYVITKNSILWEKEVEGEISKVNINSNGYVSVILSGTAYKSVIVLYDNNGTEIFKTYLSTTIAIDTDVSSDNKYLTFAEVNISGTVVQSNIKIISIEKAKISPSESIVYTYNSDKDKLILNIKYQAKNKIVCMYDNSIHIIEDNEDKEIVSLDGKDKKMTFVDIELDNSILKIVEENSGLFQTNTTAEILNTSNQKQNIYNITGAIKGVYCYGNKIGINLGSEVHFIDSNGWLVKKYISTQEIRGIVMSDKIATIIYKNKIEIINL